jgi:N-acetylmuramoyl-L-alanine amidase
MSLIRTRRPLLRCLTALVCLLVLSQAASESFAQRSAVTKKKQKRAQARSVAGKALNRQQVREAELMLSSLGYWTGPIDGLVDEASRHALVAFQKVEGRGVTGRFTAEEFEAIKAARRPSPRRNGGAHIEIDLSRQILFVVDEGGEVSRILPVSSGNGKEFTSEGWTRRAITPPGNFKVHNKIPGWRKSPLGRIYYPVYFLDGIAIHGYSSVPTRPASHGCVRIPMFAAKELNEMTPVGTSVIVYKSRPEMTATK